LIEKLVNHVNEIRNLQEILNLYSKGLNEQTTDVVLETLDKDIKILYPKSEFNYSGINTTREKFDFYFS
jgi:hypothetical protein